MTEDDHAAVFVAECLLERETGKFQTLTSSIRVLRDCWDRFSRQHIPLPAAVLQLSTALDRRMVHKLVPVSTEMVYSTLDMLQALLPHGGGGLQMQSEWPGVGKFEPSVWTIPYRQCAVSTPSTLTSKRPDSVSDAFPVFSFISNSALFFSTIQR